MLVNIPVSNILKYDNVLEYLYFNDKWNFNLKDLIPIRDWILLTDGCQLIKYALKNLSNSYLEWFITLPEITPYYNSKFNRGSN